MVQFSRLTSTAQDSPTSITSQLLLFRITQTTDLSPVFRSYSETPCTEQPMKTALCEAAAYLPLTQMGLCSPTCTIFQSTAPRFIPLEWFYQATPSMERPQLAAHTLARLS